MALRFPSDEWIKDLARRLNASASYEASARDWEGDLCFVVEPDEAYPETTCLYLGLTHGKSTGAAVVASADEREVEFVIRAPYTAWRRVVEGKLDPIQGMMTRQLRVTGNLLKIMRYPRAVKEIIDCCALVETDFEGAG